MAVDELADLLPYSLIIPVVAGGGLGDEPQDLGVTHEEKPGMTVSRVSRITMKSARNRSSPRRERTPPA